MRDMMPDNFTSRIKEKIHELGFQICGIARVRPLEEYRPWLMKWIDTGMNDIMGYLARNIDNRLNPESLLPGAKSIIVTGLSYYSENMQKDPAAPILSRYTYGTDYHKVIGGKLETLLKWIKKTVPEAEGRVTVDNAPLLEKAWAKEAGLGWQGRHSVMINKEIGSFFFIGTILLNIELEYDRPFAKDYCGNCRICIDECPTRAINDNHTINAGKCIANLTIERRGPIPENIIPKLGNRIYGCDKCQEVCPWNKNVRQGMTPEFAIDDEIAGMSLEQWKNLSEGQFVRLFKKTSMGRVSFEKIKGNIAAALRTAD